MMDGPYFGKYVVTPIRLHLELLDDHLSAYEQRMLKRYGESSTGRSISRDILIPPDMPLHNLHYAIQRLFGWQNSHLRSFALPNEEYLELTGGTVKEWADLVGILFQPPGEAEGDLYWDDNYERGSINAWLKKRYTGPYRYGGMMEHPEAARADIEDFLDAFKMLDVRETFWEYARRSREDGDQEVKILRRAPLVELSLEEMNASIQLDCGTESLLERLEVNKVLAASNEDLAVDGVFPVTAKLVYNYDFGDNWIVNITKMDNCEDLLQANDISEEELARAEDIVMDSYKPVCLKKDGLSVLDDVGGLGGYARFLGIIYESDNKEDVKSYRAWAQGLGWNARKFNLQTWL